MKKTFTAIDVIDGKFVATIFDPTNNQEIFKTRPHRTQLQATQEINDFLISRSTDPSKPQKREVIVNTTNIKAPPSGPKTGPATPRRCCGR